APRTGALAAQADARRARSDIRTSRTRASGKRLSLSARQGECDAPRHPRHHTPRPSHLSGDADASRHDRRSHQRKAPNQKRNRQELSAHQKRGRRSVEVEEIENGAGAPFQIRRVWVPACAGLTRISSSDLRVLGADLCFWKSPFGPYNGDGTVADEALANPVRSGRKQP